MSINHLNIEQATSSIEVVSSSVIDKLYELALNPSLDVNSNILGNLQVTHAYQDAIDYLLNKFPGLQINVTGGAYIRFADPVVASICATNWGDGTGITNVQAAIANTNLDAKFQKNTSITSFDELKKFTSVTTIGGWGFNGCTNLVSIDLSNIVTLGAQCFADCTALTTINLSSKFTTVTNWYGCFNNCISLKDVGDISGLTKIYPALFRGCSSLVSITTLSTSCTSLGSNCFYGCSKLVEVSDLSGVTSIGDSVFYACTKLVNINAPNVTSIGSQACMSCISLDYVDFPLVTSIGNQAFQQCTTMRYAKFGSTNPPTLGGTGVFSSTTCKIYVPDDSVAAYKAATNWSAYASRIFSLTQFAIDFPNG